MPKKYDYDETNEKKSKRIVICVLLLAAFIISFIAFKNIFSKEKTQDIDYESVLVEAAKKYAINNKSILPTYEGKCSKVELSKLKQLSNIKNNEEFFNTCDKSKTYVNICMVSEDNIIYYSWLTCTNYKSEALYDKEVEGTEEDIKSNSVISFKYLPQELPEDSEFLDEEEEVWEDEIEYKNYKLISSNKYYRYKDQMWLWNININKYYSLNGETEDSSKINDYYISQPSDKYKIRDESSKSVVYKWYTSEQKKEYYQVNGTNAYSLNAVGEYTIKDTSNSKVSTFYKEVLDIKKSVYYYSCAKDSTSSVVINQEVPCKNASGINEQNSGYTVQIKTFYGCPPSYQVNSNDGVITESSYCVKLGEILDSCPTDKKCIKGTSTSYLWYKYVDTGKKIYYPSGSSSVGSEKVYYKNSPVDGSIKDESTKTNGYKYYYTVKGQTSTYYSESPSSGATKTSSVKWSDYSEWSIDEPIAKDYRTIESKYKLTIKKIEDGATLQNIGNKYYTEDEIIEFFKEEGYNVNSIDDINNSGEIGYIFKIYIRNKKES